MSLRRLLPFALAAFFLAPFAASLPGGGPLGPPNAMPLPTLASPAAAVGGAWEAPFEGQIPAIHIALLNDGRVLYWSGDQAGDADWIYFLSTVQGSETRTLAPPYTAATVSTPSDPSGRTVTLFCSDHTILPDGRVLSAGGSIWHATVSEQNPRFVDGTADANVFDPATSTWSKVADLTVPRWYPTLMTVSGDRALAASGIWHLPDPTTHEGSMETYAPTADTWTTVPGGSNILPLYPRLVEVPSGPMKGQIYYAVGGTLWGPFGERPEEAAWNIPQAFDPATHAWRYLTNLTVFGVRQSPDVVMLPLDPADGYHAKLLTFAGTLQRSIVATNTAEMTDFAYDPPSHAAVAPLHTPRWQSTGVLLPDGKVLAVGGGLYDNVMTYGTPDPAVMTAEIYDPAANAWTETPPMTIPREYHGTALLLPDARVLVGGHVPNPVPWKALRDNVGMANQSAQTKFEIYDPPYLHWGATRAVIDEAPATIHYGARFKIDATGAFADAILIRNSAETHSSDPSQRAIVLPVKASQGNEYWFDAPADDVLAPGGPWMLFLRTSTPDGLVPSVAKIVMLGP